MRRAAFVRTAVAAAERLSRNLEYGGGCFLRGEGWKDRIQAYRFNTGGHFYRRRYLISHRVIKVHNVHPGYIQAYCHRKKAIRSFRQERILTVRPKGLRERDAYLYLRPEAFLISGAC
ncbi:hypothetical protein LJK87_17005 [Paenibacillus sp. P25]|nr:hypothetical protein LJK87_17005 [Paenibacillus sp. P25]